MYFGATTYTFRWNPPYMDAIKCIAKLGFKSTELPIWNQEILENYYSKATNLELKHCLQGEGLRLSEVFCVPVGMANPDQKVRAGSVEFFKRVLDVAHQLGADLVVSMVPFPFEITIPQITNRLTSQEWMVEYSPGLDWGKNWQDTIDVLKQFARACENLEMRFALEPHPYRMVRNAASMLRIIDHVESSAIGLNLDTSHLFPLGELPNVVIYEINERVFHTHISDNDGLSNAHWRPGKGKIHWPSLLRALKEVGYEGPLSLELHDVPGAAGSPALHRSPYSTPEIEYQHRMAMEFLLHVCEEEEIDICG